MLELRNVSLATGSRLLLKPFSLQISDGETVTLMGPSGSGKSSLLSLIGGTLDDGFTFDGEVLLNGRNLLPLAAERRCAGRLFQDDLLFPHMTVGENLMFATRGPSRRERLARVAAALASVGLEGMENKPPHQLSGGERARAALMRALLAEPHALLLDEPFSKLDQALRGTIRALVFDTIRQRGIPALLVTHDAADAPPGGRILSITPSGDIQHV